MNVTKMANANLTGGKQRNNSVEKDENTFLTKEKSKAKKQCVENKKSSSSLNKWQVEIPLKLPSLNDYILKCRSNRFAGAQMKKKIEKDISVYINKLPIFNKPIKIHFTWVEANKRRDYDNIAFSKKFILDALQSCGKLENDNRKWVVGFADSFELGKEYKVILDIEEQCTNEDKS